MPTLPGDMIQRIIFHYSNDRTFFTRQGLHINSSGKEKIVLKIANVVTKIFLKKEETISL